jgi:hypothetical protein
VGRETSPSFQPRWLGVHFSHAASSRLNSNLANVGWPITPVSVAWAAHLSIHKRAYAKPCTPLELIACSAMSLSFPGPVPLTWIPLDWLALPWWICRFVHHSCEYHRLPRAWTQSDGSDIWIPSLGRTNCAASYERGIVYRRWCDYLEAPHRSPLDLRR